MRNLLILILVVAGIWWVQRAIARAKERAAEAGRTGRKKGGRAVASPERIIECAHCGLNVPESEGVRDDDRFYCSDAHRIAGPRAD